MKYLDIHSHILLAVDDGAKDLEMSLELLKLLKEQDVTHVIATPHFYPEHDSFEDFLTKTETAYSLLKSEICESDLPEIFLGCELRYFDGIGKLTSIRQFAIKNTDYLLLELPYSMPITDKVLEDITAICDNTGLIVILAHVERYAKVKGYKKLLKFIESGTVLAHINAGGVLSKDEGKICKKLLKGGYISFLASDTHSPNHRPPEIKKALEKISETLGKSVANRLIIKSNRLLDEIEEKYAK